MGSGLTSKSLPSARPAMTARRVAFDVLRAVREDDAYANLLLPVRIERAKLSPADSAFATELCYGTLRMRGFYDRVIELAARRSTSAIDPDVLDVLRLGVHQLLNMRTAQHAAVNESVSLASAVVGRRVSGFVNGVLRTITRSVPEQWHARVRESASSRREQLAYEYSHEPWIVTALEDALVAHGAGADQLTSLLEADNAPNRPTLVVLPGMGAGSGPDSEPGDWSPTARKLAGPQHLRSVPGLAEGMVRVQDEGSQLAALALSRCVPVRPDEKWLDLCAGPGGKSALLAAEARQTGASLVANEVNPTRAGLVRSALRVFSPSPEVWEMDGRDLGVHHPEQFDRILVDAPCTGLGALRRRPESRWRRRVEDVNELVVLQSELLDSAVAALRPAGILAYVTCSPHREETLGQVAALRESHPTLVSLDAGNVLSQVTGRPFRSGPLETVQLWPHQHGTDAMFISLLRKP